MEIEDSGPNQGGILQLDSVGVHARAVACRRRRCGAGRVKMVAAILAATLATSGGAVFAPSARAQSAELREARDHFRRGKEAYSAQRFEDAYREFEAGYRLSSRPLFLFNMGHAKRRAGAPGEARALFRRSLELQPDSPQRAEVEAILRELEPAAPPL